MSYKVPAILEVSSAEAIPSPEVRLMTGTRRANNMKISSNPLTAPAASPKTPSRKPINRRCVLL